MKAFQKSSQLCLPESYYLNPDVLFLSKNLLGKFLFSVSDAGTTGGMIVETEAYKAPEDKASHAYLYKKTPRNEVMFQRGGVAYVYVCYGLHYLLNVVTYLAGKPHAILIRAIEPIEGQELMLKRRKKDKVDRRLCGGPGALTQALGISKAHNGLSFTGPHLYIQDCQVHVPDTAIVASPRVGIDYAGEYKNKPWRFRLKDSSWTSLPRR